MEREIAWNALKNSIYEVFPEFTTKNIHENNSLRDLGANSIDRAEIITSTLARLKINISLVEFAKSKNIKEIIDVISSHLVVL